MRDGRKLGYSGIVKNLLVAAVPLALTVGIFATAWWYITIYNAQTPAPVTAAAPAQLAQPRSQRRRFLARTSRKNSARRNPKCGARRHHEAQKRRPRR